MSENDPTILYAVRHGETEWNCKGKQQGYLDSPLTEFGFQQAQTLADGLSGKGIEVLYSSVLGRAMQTAHIIGRRLGLAVNAEKHFRERHLGVMEGLSMLEFRNKYPDEWAFFSSGDPDYALPDGESAKQFYDRCVNRCIELTEYHAGQRILVVTHGGVLKSFFYHALCIPLIHPRRFSLFNAAINCFVVSKDQWRLETWGYRPFSGK